MKENARLGPGEEIMFTGRFLQVSAALIVGIGIAAKLEAQSDPYALQRDIVIVVQNETELPDAKLVGNSIENLIKTGKLGPVSKNGVTLQVEVEWGYVESGLHDLRLTYQAGRFAGEIEKFRHDITKYGPGELVPKREDLTELATAELLRQWEEHKLRAAMIAYGMQGAPKP